MAQSQQSLSDLRANLAAQQAENDARMAQLARENKARAQTQRAAQSERQTTAAKRMTNAADEHRRKMDELRARHSGTATSTESKPDRQP